MSTSSLNPTQDQKVHHPSSCTCGRIIWLTANCDDFAMNLRTSCEDASITARIGSTHCEFLFRPERLKIVVADVYRVMWNAWEPAEGIKLSQAE